MEHTFGSRQLTSVLTLEIIQDRYKYALDHDTIRPDPSRIQGNTSPEDYL